MENNQGENQGGQVEEKQIPKSNWMERLQQRNQQGSQGDPTLQGEAQGESNVSDETKTANSVLDDVNNQSKGNFLDELENADGNNSDPVDTSQQGSDGSNGNSDNNADENIENNNESGSNWYDDDDSSVSNNKGNNSTPNDYSSLGKALGVEGGTEEALVGHYQELQSKVSAYEKQIEEQSSNSVFANEEIARANEISKNGGDWKAFLEVDQMDFSGIDDDIIIKEFGLKPIFGDDAESMNAALAELKPHQVKQEAYKLRKDLELDKREHMRKLESDALKKREGINNSIRDQLTSTNEMYGMSVDNSMKKKMYNSITSEDFMNSIFYDKQGKFDPKKVVEVSFLVNNIKNIVKTNINNARNGATKQIFDEISQPNIKRQGDFAAPKQQKKLTALDQAMNSLRGKQK